MPDTAKAEYLTRTFDENGVEILKKAIEQDIHKFSHIPCMSDESFGGNVSGVAMEFKLLGMESEQETDRPGSADEMVRKTFFRPYLAEHTAACRFLEG